MSRIVFVNILGIQILSKTVRVHVSCMSTRISDILSNSKSMFNGDS